MTTQTTLPRHPEHDEKHLNGLPIEELLDRLPTYAQIIGFKWPEGTTDAELRAWSFGAEQASEHVKDIIERWRRINAKA